MEETQEKIFAKLLTEQMDALNRYGPNLENTDKLTAALKLVELTMRIDANRRLRLTIDLATDKIAKAIAD